MKDRISTVLKESAEYCFKKGLLEKIPLPAYVIEVPNNPEHGHFATNLPLLLAASQKRPPRDIALTIVTNFKDREDIIEKAEVAGPGFINFRIRKKVWHRLLSFILERKEFYGQSNIGQGQKILVEFVSANPTGPLHLGHGRGAAVGDTLSRILSFSGYEVVREFYINDAGQQIRLLGESIFSRIKQIDDPDFPFPENGYRGDYILDLAQAISKDIKLNNKPEEEAINTCAQKGKAIMLEEIKKNLSRFRVDFDTWYNESNLYNSGLVEKALAQIKNEGGLYEKDGALWIRTSDFGDDKDRVIRKRDGQFTYFASDISYHLDKKARGFHRAINIWGADHHGYIPRIKAALSANGIPKNWLSVLLIQLVKLWENGQEIKMSKRAGSFVTLQELVDEVGVDAVRFVFLTKNHDSSLDFDLDLVKKQDSENPVYYVQYAHARICSIFRKAREEGINIEENITPALDKLELDEEIAIIRAMSEFPYLLEDIATTLEPHRLTYFLTELAAMFHRYFNLGMKNPENRIITGDVTLSQARLCLALAVKIVIGNGLKLLGITAPQKM